jgi:DNA-directed RNA polymerase specialized sigma24 family protein
MEDEIDLQLRQLAIEAQNHPAGSKEREEALRRLMDAIYRSHRLVRPYIYPNLRHLYEDIYSEASLKIFEHIRQNIDTYDSQQPLMAWVNHFFNFRFQDVRDRYIRETKRRDKFPSCDDLENMRSPAPDFFDDSEILRRFIQEDPEGIFRNTSLQSRPDLTLQDVILARLDDLTWEAIGDNFGISPQTISSFLQRNLRKYNDVIRNNLQ